MLRTIAGKIYGGLLVVFSVLKLPACAGCIDADDTNSTVQPPPEYIYIPAGKFTPGPGQGNWTIEIPAFRMMTAPVTVAKYKKCIESGGCSPEHYETAFNNPYCNYHRGDDWDNHPMNCIDWTGAAEYCEWIKGSLPTPEQWEYAATHEGKKQLSVLYPWGNALPIPCVTANYNGCNETGTSPVGAYSPAGDSPLGLVDMSGNVWEWTDSLHPTKGTFSAVLKGGSWMKAASMLTDDDRNLRIAGSSDIDSTSGEIDVGFRCVK